MSINGPAPCGVFGFLADSLNVCFILLKGNDSAFVRDGLLLGFRGLRFYFPPEPRDFRLPFVFQSALAVVDDSFLHLRMRVEILDMV